MWLMNSNKPIINNLRKISKKQIEFLTKLQKLLLYIDQPKIKLIFFTLQKNILVPSTAFEQFVDGL